MKKSGNFGTIGGGKRRGIQKKNPFSFGLKPLKTIGFIDKNESMCGVKAFINLDQAPKGAKICRVCGLYHHQIMEPEIKNGIVRNESGEFSGCDGKQETINV